MPDPKYSKPAYVKVPTKTELRKQVAALKRDLKAGLNGPDADIYQVMLNALNNSHLTTQSK